MYLVCCVVSGVELILTAVRVNTVVGRQRGFGGVVALFLAICCFTALLLAVVLV